MPQLSQSVVGKTKLIIREGAIDIKSLLGSYSDLELMLSPRISNYLPVVHPIKEWSIRGDGAEVVIGLEQECMPVICGEGDLLRAHLRVPAELPIRLRVHIVYLVIYHAVNLLCCGQWLLLFLESRTQLCVGTSSTCVFVGILHAIDLLSRCITKA